MMREGDTRAGCTPRQKEGTRERILKAAMKVFAERGFQRATVDLIAKEAGVSKGLVFWYFKSKGRLIEEAAIRSLPIDIVRAHLSKGAPDGRELLRRIALDFIRKYEDPVPRKLFLHTLSLTVTHERLAARLNELCEMILQQLARQTLGRADHEERIRMRAFFGGLLCYVLRRPKDIPTEEYVEHLVNTVWKGKPKDAGR